MTTIRLLPKQQIRIDGTVYEVVRRTGDGDISLQDVQTLAPCALSDDQVATLFLEGSLAFVEPGEEVEEGFNPRIADFSQLPVNLKEEARRREAYVRPVRQRCLPHSAAYLKPLISEVAAKLEDPNPPSVATLCRWLQRWKNSGERDVRALVPNYFGRGNRTRRLPHQVLQIINEAVDIVYLQPEGTTIRAAWSKAVADIHRINQGRPENTALPMPSERTIGKRIAAIDRYDRMRARKGRRMADHEYLPVGAGPRASRPLEVVEADHTQMDIILLSKDGVVLGRPWLTAIIDRYSRCPTGFYVGFEPPSTLSVSNALRNAILPKDYVEKFPGVENTWPCFGVPETIVVDNGPEFHSAAFNDACCQLGINVQYTPVKSPWFKGRIESWLGTVSKSFCHQLPGTTFSDAQQRGDYQSEKQAAISFDLFIHLFHKWVVDVVMFERHSGINGVPRQFWEEGTKAHPVRLPKRHEDLDPLLGGLVERKLSRRGIEFSGLLYNSEELKRLRTHPGVKKDVKVRYDPSNLDRVWVIDPTTGSSVEIPSVDPDYTSGLTLAQHKVVRRYATEKARGYVSIEQLCIARDELFRMAQESLSAKQKGTRARVARHLGIGGTSETPDEALQKAAGFMGDAPQALGGAGLDSPVLAKDGDAVKPRRKTKGAATRQTRPKGQPDNNNERQQDEDDPIDPSALGIKVVARR